MRWLKVLTVFAFLYGCESIELEEDKMAVRVPDTNTFSLQDVVLAVEDHAGDIKAATAPLDKDDLGDCFDQAIASYFDSNYNNDTYAVPNSMKRFRNYGPNATPCGGSFEFPGGVSYPSVISLNLGTNTGNVHIDYNVYEVPDLVIVEWNGERVANSGWQGYAMYDYGGAKRSEFTSALAGKNDPIIGWPYPNSVYWPDDGYPRVSQNISDRLTFMKSTAESNASVKVYAPMANTAWLINTSCPDGTAPESIIVPTGFSPNGDGVHDYFEVYSLWNYPNHKMSIFDRFGNLLYQRTNSYDDYPWDGRYNGQLVPTGNYTWVLEIDGSPYDSGTVMVAY